MPKTITSDEVETLTDFHLVVESHLPAVLSSIVEACFRFKCAPNKLVTLLCSMNCPNGRFMYISLHKGIKCASREEARRVIDEFVDSDERRGEMLIATYPLDVLQAYLRILKDDETADKFQLMENPRDTWIFGLVGSAVWVDGFTFPEDRVALDAVQAREPAHK